MYNNLAEEVHEVLKSKKALDKCVVCGSHKLAVNPGVAVHKMYGRFSASTAHCAIVVCENCGLIREHSLEALGIEVPENSFDVEFEAR